MRINQHPSELAAAQTLMEPEPELEPLSGDTAADAAVKSKLLVQPGDLHAGPPTTFQVEVDSLPALKDQVRTKFGFAEDQPIDVVVVGDDGTSDVLRDIKALPPKARVDLRAAAVKVHVTWDLGSRPPCIWVDGSESIEVGACLLP